MLRIPVPKVSFATQEVSLNGETFKFTFRFNERTGAYGRWKLDISKSDGTAVVNGLTLVEDTFMTTHLTLPNFVDGQLGVFQAESDPLPAGRNNVGVGKSYELLFFDNSELGI